MLLENKIYKDTHTISKLYSKGRKIFKRLDELTTQVEVLENKITTQNEIISSFGNKISELEANTNLTEKLSKTLSHKTLDVCKNMREIEMDVNRLELQNNHLNTKLDSIESNLNQLLSNDNNISSVLESQYSILYILVFLSIFVCIFFIIFLFKKKIKMILKNYIDKYKRLMDYGFEGFPLRKDFSVVGFVESLYFPVSKKVSQISTFLTKKIR